ncbi:MAG TPA: addiction module protein [Chitinophagales bacterium]|nr:addiction module protein [Chitinophagales bacterium]
MKQLTLNIDENKFNTFLSFIKTLDYVSISNEEEIPSWQQDEVNRRIQLIESGEMKMHKWSDVKNEIFKK